MDEIFLKDYANNVAMAQQPTGVAAIQAQPGFEGYVPSFSSVDQPMVNENLLPGGGVNLPPLKEIALNILEDRAKNYVINKAGLKGLQGNILKGIVNPYVGIASMMPGNINPINALANLNTQVQSSLFGRSKTMSDYLASEKKSKRLFKEKKLEIYNNEYKQVSLVLMYLHHKMKQELVNIHLVNRQASPQEKEEQHYMAKINAGIPEPTPEYRQETKDR